MSLIKELNVDNPENALNDNKNNWITQTPPLGRNAATGRVSVLDGQFVGTQSAHEAWESTDARIFNRY